MPNALFFCPQALSTVFIQWMVDGGQDILTYKLFL